jgi:penicillin-binding protein 1C
VGIPRFLERLGLLGFQVPADAAERWGLGMAIGNAEVSLLELVRAFSLFPRGGSLPALEVLQGAGTRAGSARRVGDPVTAWLVCDMLSDPAARAPGFGTRTWFGLPFPAMFKSGTSSEFTDLWCVGATPRWTVGAWAGNFDGRAVINRTGSSLPARIVADVLARLEAVASSKGPPLEFDRPAGIAEARICTVSGGTATAACPATREEYFASARDVPQPCAYHGPGGSRQELLYSSLLGAGGSPRIVLPVDDSTFWLDRRLSAAVQRVPLMVAASPAEGAWLSLRMDGVEVRRLPGSAVLDLPAAAGPHRVELVGPGVHEEARFTVR